jgi:hypothetical protein
VKGSAPSGQKLLRAGRTSKLPKMTFRVVILFRMYECDDELISSIVSDVMRFLQGQSFFEKLDDALSPTDASHPAIPCRATYEASETILRASGVEDSDLADIFCVMKARGGGFNCEILYNVSESNRLKNRYWQERSEGRRTGYQSCSALIVRSYALDIPRKSDFTGTTVREWPETE